MFFAPKVVMDDIIDTLGDFYKNVIGSPIALFGFLVFLIVTAFVYWLISDENAVIVLQTYAVHYLGPYLPMTRAIFTVIIMVWVVGIVYVFLRSREIDNIEYHKYRSIDVKEEEVREHDTQWQIVLEHLYSEIAAEWRIAILEADAMLDEAIKSAGGSGDTLGERLKSLDSGDFQTLQSAWDAHKIRNMIAHEGINFQLTQREAKRVIDLYEKVLSELKYVD